MQFFFFVFIYILLCSTGNSHFVHNVMTVMQITY